MKSLTADLAFLFLWLLTPALVLAQELPEAIRCDGAIVSAGMLRSTVLAKCGQPVDKVQYSRLTTIHTRFYKSPDSGLRMLDRFRITYHDSSAFKKAVSAHDADRQFHYTLLRLPASDVDFSLHRDVFNDSLLLTALDPTFVVWRCDTFEEEVEQWVYNPGPTAFIRVLTFKNGVLERISLEGYGYY